MASINGIMIANLKEFRGHEEERLFQGDIYYRFKKLGFWSQDFSGGDDVFGFDEKALSREVEAYRKNGDLFDERYRKYIDLEILLDNLVTLMEDEEKWLKTRGVNYVRVTDDLRSSSYTTRLPASEILNSQIHKEIVWEFEKMAVAPVRTYIYTKSEDFVKEY